VTQYCQTLLNITEHQYTQTSKDQVVGVETQTEDTSPPLTDIDKEGCLSILSDIKTLMATAKKEGGDNVFINQLLQFEEMSKKQEKQFQTIPDQAQDAQQVQEVVNEYQAVFD
jgi:hypothetical protein